MVDTLSAVPMGGITSPLLQQAYQTDPRVALARVMLQNANNNTAPLYSPLQTLAKALSSGVAGATNVELGREYQNRQKALSDTMAKALQAGENGIPASVDQTSGQTTPAVAPGFDALAKTLSESSDPVAQQMGMQYGIQGMMTRQALQAKLAETLAGQGLMLSPQGGVAKIPGYGEARGGITEAESAGRAAGKLPSEKELAAYNKGLDLQTAGPIAQAQAQAKLPSEKELAAFNAGLQVQTAGPKAAAAAAGKLPYDVVPVPGVGAFPKSVILGTVPKAQPGGAPTPGTPGTPGGASAAPTPLSSGVAPVPTAPGTAGIPGVGTPATAAAAGSAATGPVGTAGSVDASPSGPQSPIVALPGGGVAAVPYNNAEPAYMTDLARDMVTFRRGALDNAKEAQRTDAALGQFQTAIDQMKARGTQTGYFTPALAELAAGAKSLGIDTSHIPGMPKPEDVGDAQTAQKVSKAIFGEVLKKLFPQRITNVDMKVMEGIAPGLGLDERANQNLISAIQGQNQYDKNLATSMLDYEAHHRNLYGFEKEFYKAHGFGPLGFAYAKQPGESAPQGNASPPSVPVGATATGPNNQRMKWNGIKWEPM